MQYDCAFAVLGEAGPDPGAWAESPGTQAIGSADVEKGTHVDAFGYPHASSCDGTDLTYCAGDAGLDNRLAKLTYELRCDITGGSSGGPWLADVAEAAGTGTVISLNSYGDLGKKAIYGPALGAATKAVDDEAVTTDSSAPLVVVP